MLRFSLPFLIFYYLAIFPIKTNSQVLPDPTANTQVDQNGNTTEITGGETRGNNLFHSFQDFSVQTGNEAFFNNANDISNIFSRVTGGNISNIDGFIKANGNANLFLINPSGIIFGENARLDIGGSFLATTAEKINFPDGDFDAIAPEESNLTVDIPIGLGFGSNPGNISVEGSPNNVQIENPSFRIITENIPEGIQVNPDKDIFLIGGNINFNGGGLKAPGGNIELGSVDGNQNIGLAEQGNGKLNATFENIANFKDITFNNAAYVDVSGEIAGNINIDGRQILVNDGSTILANTSLSSENSIEINASKLLELKGTSGQNDTNSSLNRIREIASGLRNTPSTANFGSPTNDDSNFYSISLIGADISSSSDANGNNININAQNLKVFDAAQIRVGNFSPSSSTTGNIDINAQNILVEGTNNIDGFINSEITSTTGIGTRGNGSNVKISSQTLTVKDGGQITNDTFGFGSAGNIEVDSNYIQLTGVDPFARASSTGLVGTSSSESRQNSNGANISIKTQKLDILDRAKINVSSFGSGTPGNISIQAEEINIDTGENTNDGNFSGIVAAVNPLGRIPNRLNLTSESGTISINTNSLKILNGARIEADGNSGNIDIIADNIELNGTRPIVGNFIGGISTSTRPRAFGDGGNIDIKTDSLKVLNGSIIRAISLGTGDAGNIEIDAQTIEISGVDRFASSPIASGRNSKINTGSQRSNGGNILIDSDLLEINNFGSIEALTNGEGTGGQIFLENQSLILQNQSFLDANSNSGNGGNININSDSVLGIENSDITANSISGNGGNIIISSDLILGLEARSQLTASSDITASSELGLSGNLILNTPDLFTDDEVKVAFKDLDFYSKEKLLNQSCLVSNRSPKASSIVVLGQNGFTENSDTFLDNPDFLFNPDALENSPNTLEKSNQPVWNKQKPLIEANSIQVTPDGRTLFVAKVKMKDVKDQICQKDLIQS